MEPCMPRHAARAVPPSQDLRTARLRTPGLMLLVALCASCTPTTPIDEARAMRTGDEVTLRGYVTVPPGAFSSALGDPGFALQDDTGGIYVKVDTKQPYDVGTRVRVTGILDEQNRLRILKAAPADMESGGGRRVLAPRDVGTGDVDEDVEGLLIRVSGAVTRTFQDDSPYGYKLYVDDGGGEVQVFVHVSAGFERGQLEALALGERITVVGLAAQYETTYEVAPRFPSDLTRP